MPPTARNTLAIVGAGPIGLEAAAAALAADLDVHLFERGEVASHPIAWGHVTLFTPWRMNVGAASAALLARSGWAAPDPESFPTGLELAEHYLQPLARAPELAARVHAHSQVVSVSRSGMLKGDGPAEARRAHPFRLLVRDASGRENYLHAAAVIDASGTYGTPNWAGDGGIPARNELYLAPQMSYHLDDVRGLRRERYAGKRTLVIGGGATAATLVTDLVKLADEVPGTAVAWATRKTADRLYAIADDPLPMRRALYAGARELATGAHPAVSHTGGVRLDALEFNSATHRYRANFLIGDRPHVEEVDHILVATGFGPDNALYRELQVHECYSTRGPMKLAAAIEGSTDCVGGPAAGGDALENPEPDFWILGNKSYGRSSNFLLETGYRQVADVIARLAERVREPAST